LKLYYNPKLKERAKELRRNATFGERLLWKYLRGRQLLGYQFIRQKPIDEYIVDFYCSKLQLVIEIDGVTHNGKKSYDKRRENRLRNFGLYIIRIDGYYILKNITGALEIIAKKINELEGKTTP